MQRYVFLVAFQSLHCWRSQYLFINYCVSHVFKTFLLLLTLIMSTIKYSIILIERYNQSTINNPDSLNKLKEPIDQLYKYYSSND